MKTENWTRTDLLISFIGISLWFMFSAFFSYIFFSNLVGESHWGLILISLIIAIGSFIIFFKMVILVEEKLNKSNSKRRN